MYLAIAVAITIAYGFFLFSFWAPAPGRPGIDENAYLVGAKDILQHASYGFHPTSDFQFEGHMWVRTKSGWYYPKYPPGTSVLMATAMILGGPHHGRDLAFAVDPFCMTLAVLGMFFLARTIVNSFYSLLGAIVLGTGITSLQLCLLPNSHAADLCFVVWGMFFLIRWWQTGKWRNGIAAGLILGFAVTIRYTEALLLFPLYPIDQIFSDTNLAAHHPHWWMLIKIIRFAPIGPIGLVALLMVQWKRAISWLHAAIPILAWAVPVGLMVSYTWFSMGHITGYDATHESAGFTTKEFLDKWDYTIYQVYLFGLFMLAPLGVAGLVMMYRNRSVALLLTLWFLPATLLYTSYYWGDGVPGVAFLRFLLSVYPPLIIAAMWMLRRGGASSASGGSIVNPLAAGLLTAAAAAIGLRASLPDMERQHRGNMNLHYSALQIMHHVPQRSTDATRPVFFADEGMFPMLLQYTQFMIDGDWYASDSFEHRAGGGFGLLGILQKKESDTKMPVLLDQNRIDFMDKLEKGKSDADFIAMEHQAMDQAFARGAHVYVILPKVHATYFRDRFISAQYKMKQLDYWSEPCAVKFPEPQPGQPMEEDPLAPPVMSGEPLIDWQPRTWHMYEIVKAPPTTIPKAK